MALPTGCRPKASSDVAAIRSPQPLPGRRQVKSRRHRQPRHRRVSEIPGVGATRRRRRARRRSLHPSTLVPQHDGRGLRGRRQLVLEESGAGTIRLERSVRKQGLAAGGEVSQNAGQRLEAVGLAAAGLPRLLRAATCRSNRSQMSDQAFVTFVCLENFLLLYYVLLNDFWSFTVNKNKTSPELLSSLRAVSILYLNARVSK